MKYNEKDYPVQFFILYNCTLYFPLISHNINITSLCLCCGNCGESKICICKICYYHSQQVCHVYRIENEEIFCVSVISVNWPFNLVF